MAYRYKPNKYVIYDDTLTFQENYERDAVITKKKLDRLEDQVRLSSADFEIGTVKYVERTEEADFSLDFNEIEGTRRLNMSIPLRGKSAYQSWLDLGNVGTEEDFINDLKGLGQHRVKLKRFELENIHGNDDAFLSLYKCLDDEARIYVEHKADATGTVPEFNARFYGPFEARSAKIVYSADITDSNYEDVAVIKDEDDCMYVGRRLVSGIMEDGVWKPYSADPTKAKSYWKVMWYDADGVLIDVDRYNVVFVDAADRLLYTDADSVSDLKKEFTTLLNDAVNNLRTELEATNESLANNVSEINTKLDETNTTINNTATEIRNEMQASNEQIADDMANLESDMDAKINTLDKRTKIKTF